MAIDPAGKPTPHRRKPKPSPASTSLLASWYDTLRKELADVIYGLGRLDFNDPARDKLIDRGVKVAKELGTEVDAGTTVHHLDGTKAHLPASEFES